MTIQLSRWAGQSYAFKLLWYYVVSSDGSKGGRFYIDTYVLCFYVAYKCVETCLCLDFLQVCRVLTKEFSKIMFLWTGGRSNSTSADDVILAGDRLMLKNEVGNAQIVIGQLVGPAGKCRPF